MNNRNLLIGAVVAVLAVAAALFVANRQGTSGNSGQVIRIGAILPLTGKLSVIGEGERKGLALALEELKRNNPKVSITLIIEDFKSETKNAVTAANKLINIDKVHSIITSTTAAAEAVSPITDKNKVIHFVISPDVEILNQSIYNYRIYYNFRTEAVPEVRPRSG